MADERVTVYRFDPLTLEAALAGNALYAAMQQRGLRPAWLITVPPHPPLQLRLPAGEITLPASELPALRKLQRAEPERFGGC